jgi:hypothetical protein
MAERYKVREDNKHVVMGYNTLNIDGYLQSFLGDNMSSGDYVRELWTLRDSFEVLMDRMVKNKDGLFGIARVDVNDGSKVQVIRLNPSMFDKDGKYLNQYLTVIKAFDTYINTRIKHHDGTSGSLELTVSDKPIKQCLELK